MRILKFILLFIVNHPFSLLKYPFAFSIFRKSLFHLFIDVVKDNNQKDYKISYLFYSVSYIIILTTYSLSNQQSTQLISTNR
jgi:hypothetical protein